jgi:coproporphyrinogen III oxidase
MSQPLAERMHAFCLALQDLVCESLEAQDGQGRFREDGWERPGGGGGRSRVLEGGGLFEKAGVNVSAVHGELDPAFAQGLPGQGNRFFAAGLSLVLHPKNPYVPAAHANVRYLEQGGRAWFGGGTDLTPYYLFEEDAAHFHRTLREVCERYEPGRYARLKLDCDRYFFLPHRQEARGVGGIFFDELGGELEGAFAFTQAVGEAFLPAYLPIASRRRGLPYGEREERWQQVRRGRYVEFNLVFDRGTTFGLRTHGRVESILMSLPPLVRWPYAPEVEEGSAEARLLEVLRAPKAWV